VEAKRQKLIGVPPKATDEAKLAELALKPKLMLVGTPSAALAEAAAAEAAGLAASEAIDDDLFDLDEPLLRKVHENSEYLAKVAARAASYAPRRIFTPREGKKLLVLDVDYTLFDHRSPAENAAQLARPHLHEFLERAYRHYDIAIWSATSMRWVALKMQELGCLSEPGRFRLLALYDHGAMITVTAEQYGVIDVKPLGVLWAHFEQYGPHNTIMFDDLSRNFLMNPQTGLKIRPCRGMTVAANREADHELRALAEYLELIAPLDDFRSLDHRRWEQYVARARRRVPETGSGSV